MNIKYLPLDGLNAMTFWIIHEDYIKIATKQI